MSAEQDFWHWFRQHEDELYNFEQDLEPIFDRLASEMGKVDVDLAFEFGPPENGVREFVISASGMKRAFSAVIALYNSRPQLKRFQVTAFRPRRPVINGVEFGSLRIGASDVYCHLCNDDDPRKIGILLFLPGYCQDNETEYDQIGYLLLDQALGEYDMETSVGFIEIAGHDSQYFAGALPIDRLAINFDAILESKNGT